jgi:SPP1 family predicted phage head-tail adaptor
VRTGDLRHQVILQSKTEGRDAVGGVVEAWSDVATVWASVEPLDGKEFFAAERVNADATTRIRMRYRAGVTPVMRAVYGARIFDIQNVINVDERNRELRLMVREVVT